MTDASESSLLEQFARNASEPAFAALVERHLPLVYSVARRHTADPQQAQDITQAVFILLARKANTLGHPVVLSGWLYHTARLTSANWQRAEARRLRREQEACMQSASTETAIDVVWRELVPRLETAMATLNTRDRDALVLRYFQNRSMAEVGSALGCSENTAQQRVGRALEKLRKSFAKWGISLSTGALATAISAHAVPAAPAGLAAAISATALSNAVAPPVAILAATQTIAMTTLQKTLAAATLAVLAGAAIYEARQAANARTEIQTLRHQQAPLAGQIQQLQQELDAATSRMYAANQELAQNRANQQELLKLRGEIGLFHQRPKPPDQPLKSNASVRGPMTDPATHRFDNNQVITDNASDEYARQLSDFARTNHFTGDGRNYQYALRRYAEDHNGQLPSQYADLEPYKWSGNLPLAGSYQGPDTLAGTNEYDLVYNGSLADLTNDPAKENDIAILRQRDAWPTPDGKWARVYVSYARHVFVVESADNFVSWESEHLISPP